VPSALACIDSDSSWPKNRQLALLSSRLLFFERRPALCIDNLSRATTKPQQTNSIYSFRCRRPWHLVHVDSNSSWPKKRHLAKLSIIFCWLALCHNDPSCSKNESKKCVLILMPLALTRVHSNSSHPKKGNLQSRLLVSSFFNRWPTLCINDLSCNDKNRNKQTAHLVSNETKQKEAAQEAPIDGSIHPQQKKGKKFTRGANRLFKWPPAKKCKKEAAPAFASIANQKKEAGREVLIVRSIGRQPKNAKKSQPFDQLPTNRKQRKAA